MRSFRECMLFWEKHYNSNSEGKHVLADFLRTPQCAEKPQPHQLLQHLSQANLEIRETLRGRTMTQKRTKSILATETKRPELAHTPLVVVLTMKPEESTRKTKLGIKA